MTARAYVNHGRWIADCPRGCGGAEALTFGCASFTCSNCQWVTRALWADGWVEVERALAERPLPLNRNWFPEDHPLAIASGRPHGQTPDDLRAEAHRHMNKE